MSLRTQVFLAIWAVSLGTTATVGLFARSALSSAFDRYLASMPQPRHGGRGPGRMLGAAEQTFIASVDQGVLTAAVVALMVATVVAVMIAAYLNGPLRRLEAAAHGLGTGDLSHRVEIEGPREVSALGESLNDMAESLEAAETLRRRMVADVAHELRNPLAAARAQAEGMAEGIIAADQPRLESMVEDLQHLSLLVEDLRELAVAESGQIRYDMRKIDLTELARREVRRIAPTVAASVTLGVDTESDVPVLATGDERRLGQVLHNLLSNAVRHTATGSIVVRLSGYESDVEVSVSDTGEGIAEKDLHLIFERFYRADAARASDTGGAGIGLAIAKAIVTDHGGEMFARNVPGGGATVGFRLPVG